MRNPLAVAAEAIRLHGEGPWPFVTLRRYTLGGHHFVWIARRWRKGLAGSIAAQERGPLWRTPAYNWWTGALFALGSLLFMAGAALSLLPADRMPSQALVNAVFAAGSVPFTIAAFLQNFQAANVPAFTPVASAAGSRRIALLGWHPRSLGWWSTITQLVGTIDFNFNTFDALHAPDGWLADDVAIWLPGMLGAILFLVSSYLAFIEANHAYWAWRPANLDWQIVFANLAGSVAFLTASTLAYYAPGPVPAWVAGVANVHLFIGGAGFLVGSLLMMKESRR